MLNLALLKNTEEDRRTEEAFQSPQAGDLFCEMLSFWLYVIWARGEGVITAEFWGSPCIFPDDAKVRLETIESFGKRFAYGSIPGYSIDLRRRGSDIRWAKRFLTGLGLVKASTYEQSEGCGEGSF